MDVLSEVLRVVRLNGALFFNAEFSAPWCLNTSPSADMVPYLAPGAGRLILYHFLTEGRAYVKLPEGHREELTSGDIVILPHGDAHLLGNGSPERPVDSLKAFAKNIAKGLEVARFGGGGEITRFVCGYLACEPQLSDVFLAGLPRLVKVHVAGEPSGQWLENSIRFSVCEVKGSNAGSGLVVAKLSEVLFVETLRRYINALPPDQTGWLAGARNPVIGHALALLPGTGGSMDYLAAGDARRPVAYAACSALPPFSRRVSNGLPRLMAAEAGSGEPVVDRRQRGSSRCGGGIWSGSRI